MANQGNNQYGNTNAKSSPSRDADGQFTSENKSSTKSATSWNNDSQKDAGTSSRSTQGGTHEQHVQAGKQSHKNS